MNEREKQFWVCTKPDGKKEIVWNWERNMHAGIYPEYKNIEGPYETRPYFTGTETSSAIGVSTNLKFLALNSVLQQRK